MSVSWWSDGLKIQLCVCVWMDKQRGQHETEAKLRMVVETQRLLFLTLWKSLRRSVCSVPTSVGSYVMFQRRRKQITCRLFVNLNSWKWIKCLRPSSDTAVWKMFQKVWSSCGNMCCCAHVCWCTLSSHTNECCIIHCQVQVHRPGSPADLSPASAWRDKC